MAWCGCVRFGAGGGLEGARVALLYFFFFFIFRDHPSSCRASGNAADGFSNATSEVGVNATTTTTATPSPTGSDCYSLDSMLSLLLSLGEQMESATDAAVTLELFSQARHQQPGVARCLRVATFFFFFFFFFFFLCAPVTSIVSCLSCRLVEMSTSVCDNLIISRSQACVGADPLV